MVTPGFGRVTDNDGCTLVTVIDSIDVATASMLRERLLDLYEQGKRDVVIDLTGVDLIDSSGLGVLVAALKRYRDADGNVRLRSPGRQVRKVLETTGLSRVFDIVP
ncbi:MAG: STAS domain-containing protein [Acidimicrobiales bacterium]